MANPYTTTKSHYSDVERVFLPALKRFERRIRRDIAETQITHWSRATIDRVYTPARIAQLLAQAQRHPFKGFSQRGWDVGAQDERHTAR